MMKLENHLTMLDPKNLSDDSLCEKLKYFVNKERHMMVSVISHLAEMQKRELYLKLGYSSIYQYCVAELKYTPDAAFKRMQGVRVIIKFPFILKHLSLGEYSLKTLSMLSPYLKYSEGAVLLFECRGKSGRDTEALISSRFPKADKEDRIKNSDKSELLTKERVHISFSASKKLLKKIERAKELMRHQYPHIRLENIFDEAMDVLLKKLDRNCKETPKIIGVPTPAQRTVPESVKQMAWVESGGQCTYVSEVGRRCAERSFLEFDHAKAWSIGGDSALDNIRVLCRSHNQYFARQTFGKQFIEEKINLPRGR